MSRAINTKYFHFKSEADGTINRLLMKGFATMVERKYSHKYGYWLNVTWKCGEIAPMTMNEHIQAFEEKP